MEAARWLCVVAFAVVGGGACEGRSSAASSAAASRREREARILGGVARTNLVSDRAGEAAVTAPDLVDAWGLAFDQQGGAWVSSNRKGLSPVYGAAAETRLTVSIPPPEGGALLSAPTGQVFNDLAGAGAGPFMGDKLIFATEDGTIAGWQPSHGSTATTRVPAAGAIYKGLTIALAFGAARLYAADFHNGKVDVFDASYKPIKPPASASHGLPPGYAPFNVRALGSLVVVTYAQQDDDRTDDVKGPGHGFVDLLDFDGRVIDRLVERGELDSPWGVAVAPSRDDALGFDLLIGNFGDGRINVYDVTLRGFQSPLVKLEGALTDAAGQPVVIDGLWAIAFGPGAGGFGAADLYFTAGPDDEQHGLFGKLAFSAGL
jgi:uncharacterized protein (TIGR03118 family)